MLRSARRLRPPESRTGGFTRCEASSGVHCPARPGSPPRPLPQQSDRRSPGQPRYPAQRGRHRTQQLCSSTSRSALSGDSGPPAKS
jgi:hypothetical protein